MIHTAPCYLTGCVLTGFDARTDCRCNHLRLRHDASPTAKTGPKIRNTLPVYHSCARYLQVLLPGGGRISWRPNLYALTFLQFAPQPGLTR